MDNIFDLDDKNIDLAWCPGCGNFGINKVLKSVLKELKIKPENLVIISGIGQAAKMPQYLKNQYVQRFTRQSITGCNSS